MMKQLARTLLLCLVSFPLALSSLVVALAQEDEEAAPRPKSVALPPAFSRFSANDVLQQIFEGYDPGTGRVKNLLNQEQKPAMVRIDEAKSWKTEGAERLVVIVELAGDDYQLEDLCGNCATYAMLAVLKTEGGALKLVARQRAPQSAAFSEEGDNVDESYGPLSYTGHSSMALDLAPYKLNSREKLIGVRTEFLWIPAFSYSTGLQLFRIEGKELRQVFNELVVDREYPDLKHEDGQTVLKTVSTLRTEPSSREFNDLKISKETFRCSDRDGDWDCNSRDSAVHRVGKAQEIWRFDGGKFVQDPKPGPRTRAAASEPAPRNP